MGIERPGSEAPAGVNCAFYDVVAGGYPDTGGHDPTAVQSPSPQVEGLLAHFGVDLDAVEEPTTNEF